MAVNYPEINSLINEPPHVGPAIGAILPSHQLVSVPNEVDIKSWNME
jgi:hypothetical protein